MPTTPQSCQVCEVELAAGTLSLSGPPGELTGPACLACAAEALTSAKCLVVYGPLKATVAA